MSKEIVDQIAQHVVDARNSLYEAEALADEHGLEFDFDVVYGMGGTYYSQKYIDEQGLRYREEGWNASSQSC